MGLACDALARSRQAYRVQDALMVALAALLLVSGLVLLLLDLDPGVVLLLEL